MDLQPEQPEQVQPTQEPMEKTGLFTLSNPTSSENGEIDIVAVHGLGGHWEKTWTSKQGNLWLKDYLPAQLKGNGLNARVMSYGYNADTIFSSSVGNINTSASDLLQRLKQDRDTPAKADRPILFIAHSLGGIIVEQAIITANDQSNCYGDLLEHVEALAFFGVPHHGANLANWAYYVSCLWQYSWFGYLTNRNYVHALRARSKALTDISERFKHRMRSLRIRTFFEMQTTNGYLIVDKASAALGDEEPVGVADSDHITMCKFDKSRPEKYGPVWKSILEIAKRPDSTMVVKSQMAKAGPFDMCNQYRPPDRWESLWDDPESKDIRFSERYQAPPIILIGLRALDFGKTANLRAHASVAQVTPRSFRPVLEHWSDSANYRIGGSWLEIPSNDLDFQSGYENTFGKYMKPSGSGQFRIRRQVIFYRAYESIPTVACWLTHIDSSRSKNHRMKVEANDVTKGGFCLDFYTWSDSTIDELEAGWLAFSAEREDVYCVPNARTNYGQQSQEFPLEFSGRRFQNPPSCFIALTYIDADCSKWTRIEVVSKNTTRDQMTVVARTWRNSRIFRVGFTCIAIV